MYKGNVTDQFHQVEGRRVIDTLVSRISLSSQLCIVTLALLETLVSLHLEDVMLTLVFQHLLPCTFLLPNHRYPFIINPMHPMSSSRHHLNTADTHGRGAYKLLALVPVSCDPPATPITPRRRPSSSMTPQVS